MVTPDLWTQMPWGSKLISEKMSWAPTPRIELQERTYYAEEVRECLYTHTKR